MNNIIHSHTFYYKLYNIQNTYTHNRYTYTHVQQAPKSVSSSLFSSDDQSFLPKCLELSPYIQYIFISTCTLFISCQNQYHFPGHVRLLNFIHVGHSGSCKRLPLHSLLHLLLHLHSQSPSLNQALPLTSMDELSLPVSAILPLQCRLPV